MDSGTFVISLDFELMWGVQEKKTVDSYGEQILEVWETLPRLIQLLDKYHVKATFATVGSLFAENFEGLRKCLPKSSPDYKNRLLLPFDRLSEYEGRSLEKFFFAPELIMRVAENHEIATHTFSHFYCLEEGQNEENFSNDLEAACKIAKQAGFCIESIVFPRDQVNKKYLPICSEYGITSFRGNEKSFLYKERSREKETQTRRALRFVDTYVNVSGHHCHSYDVIKASMPMDIASSRFLRPYNRKLSVLERFKIRRIKRSMTVAAKANKLFHLWWHPHNFSRDKNENFGTLEQLLLHYLDLKEQFGFKSLTMKQLSSQLRKNG